MEILSVIILFLIMVLIAEITGTIAGFGSSTILLPLSLLIFDFKTALVLVAFAHVFGNLGRVTFFKHGLDKRIILLFGIPSIILTFLGAYLVSYIPQNISILILGIFLLIFSILSLKKPDLSFKPSNSTAIIGGGLSGFFAGLIGTGGVIRGTFLTSFSLEKSHYIAVAAAIALAVDLTRIPVYLTNGFLRSEFYFLLPLILLTALTGSYIGKKIVNEIPQDLFRKIVLIAIALVSLSFIIRSLI
ncbi:sulfite exporter TauE/SafE family protein [Methanobacterium sp. ACI-7]|uniref:sulfite exporter TauE/SafE family protein n=1 Tax=unclassified Methanobacterium TaxID=2627676 RepID=UPI0039C2511A